MPRPLVVLHTGYPSHSGTVAPGQASSSSEGPDASESAVPAASIASLTAICAALLCGLANQLVARACVGGCKYSHEIIANRLMGPQKARHQPVSATTSV